MSQTKLFQTDSSPDEIQIRLLRLTAGFLFLHFYFGNGRSIFVLCCKQMDGTNTVVPAKAVRMLLAFGFHISEQIKEERGVQGGSLLRCLTASL